MKHSFREITDTLRNILSWKMGFNVVGKGVKAKDSACRTIGSLTQYALAEVFNSEGNPAYGG